MKHRAHLKQWILQMTVLTLLGGLAARTSSAHEGPPFLVITDHDMGPYVVSVWTDPDIGTGTFFVVLEPHEGEELPEGIEVKVGVEPVSGRLDEVVYRATSQPVRYGARYLSEVSFDRGEMWKVRVMVSSPEDQGEVTTKVEATPDGSTGPVVLIVSILPFLAVGFLWLKAVLRKRNPKEHAT